MRRDFWCWCTPAEKWLLGSVGTIWAVGVVGFFVSLAVEDSKRGNLGVVIGACYLFGALAGIASLLMVGANVEHRRKSQSDNT